MPKFSVKKPLTVFVAVLAILVLGVVAYTKMTPDLLPNMDFPYVVIVTADPGASPETVEADITKPMEQAMATLNEIKHITSSSQNSVSMVVLEFEQGVNMDSTGVDIQQKIATLQGGWDDTVGTPYVLKINPTMLPVEIAAVSSDEMDVAELSEFVEGTLTGKLEGITGVASVSVSGLLQRQMNVILDQEKLDALSEKLAAAVNRQLDEAKGQLEQTRKQLQDAKTAIRTAEETAITQAATKALEALRDSMQDMDMQEIRLKDKLAELQELLQRKTELELEKAGYDARIAAVENNPLLTREQKDERIAAIKAESGYVQMESELAEIELRLAALGTDMDHLLEEIEKVTQQLAQLQEKIRKFKEDNTVLAGMVEQITSGAMTVADAAQQIVAGNIQIDSALTQIESGLDTVEQSRTTALEQVNLQNMLNLSTVSALLTAQNFSMPAGYIEDTDGVRYMVSVGDNISTQEELRQLVLFDLGMEGVEPIRLEDVAEVFVTDNADSVYAKLNGENAVTVTFNKQSTYATAEVSENISTRFDELKQEYEGLEFTPLMDQGDYIRIIINSILSSLGWGALFAILILYLFLRDLRPTVITLVSIPVSVIFAVVLMYFCGVTINMISLSGLAVAVGMLVDNSVVVIENIYRLRAKGASVYQAAVAGAGQVLGAITASTLTTVCVFLPIVFVEGITKQLFTDLALTMTFSLLASLIVALTLVPAMAAGMLKKDKPIKPGLLGKLYPGYRKTVAWALRHKAIVLGASVVLLAGSAALTVQRGFVFMPEIDLNTVSVSITMPDGCDHEKAAELADEVARRAMTIDNVQTVGAAMSSSSALSMMNMGGSTGGGEYDVTAYIIVPEGESGNTVGRKLVELCRDMECEVSYAGAADSMTQMMTGSGITLRVYGDDMEDLQAAAKAAGEAIAAVEGIESVSDGLEEAASAVHITVDRAKAMEHGMTVAQIYMQVASALSTSASGADMTLDGQDMSVTIALPEEQTVNLDSLLELEIRPGSSMSSSMSSMSNASSSMSSMSSSAGVSGGQTSGESFKLGDVATLEHTVSMNTISRQEQRRCINVTATVNEEHNVTKVSAEAIRAVESLTLPGGVTTEFAGENETIMEAMEQLVLMLALGILLVYLVMVAQFQSLKSPFIVMFTIPLAFTGGFIILLIAGVELSVVSLIGFVMLVGIIVNNGIVLVDYINQLRLGGMTRQEAIIEAGITRLRPILMTSITTILGLLVMAFGGDAGTAIMQPMALVCIGGLVYATLMTLLVVPCMYDIISRKELRKVEENDLNYIESGSGE